MRLCIAVHALITPPSAYTRLSSAVMQASEIIQGGSLRTWSYRSPVVQQVQLLLCTEGRPMHAAVEVWHGPQYTPSKIRVYSEHGKFRPLNTVVATPGSPNTLAVRNIGQLQFPLRAKALVDGIDMPSSRCLSSSLAIQGGALRTYAFDSLVENVEMLLRTDGRPLNARIELLQGPNNNKQVLELYTEDGCARPFFCILQTPGAGNVVRVINTAPVEFPMFAAIVPRVGMFLGNN